MEGSRSAYGRAILPPGESAEQLSDDELLERFNSLVEQRRIINEKLTAHRFVGATIYDDVHREHYRMSYVLPPPYTALNELTVDILQCRGYDIIRTRRDTEPPETGSWSILESRQQAPTLKELRTAIGAFSSRQNLERSTLLSATLMGCDHSLLHWCTDATTEEEYLNTLYCITPDLAARARLARTIAKTSFLSLNEPREPELLEEYVEISRKYPEATPLGVEECAGIISSAIFEVLEANPQYKLENL